MAALRTIEEVASESDLLLRSKPGVWRYNEESPHIEAFVYDLATDSDDGVGTVDGYRIAQDWTVSSDLHLWNEADAMDGDVVRYVEALIRELRACEVVFDFAPSLASIQRTTLVRHVEVTGKIPTAELMRSAVACVAMIDAPTIMLVDPWPMAEERRSPQGKLHGRTNIPRLLELGFTRMVGSRFLWAWNSELDESLMEGYAYEKLVAAKRNGSLDGILNAPIADEIYGILPAGVAQIVDVPEPDDLTDE